ncbi:glycosyltransferase family 4 protein [Acidiphilium acidophilum]|uniref:Glycosyltransferase family 1 protein n=1 Tax=Acidiphilium acidophilum TaxID=76588 RepID=A0AAW9DY07_ACIAO|nr:glycosyltransferase family 1 protein [Acidiphilium acidophilum]MDX5932877.1 glycosyltransferase family 1 protein [Acidiphilium acidophilum]
MPPPPDPACATPCRIMIVSDAWHPQVNGVVRTLSMLTAQLEALGHEVMVVGPDQFRTLPCPGYREIRLAVLPGRRLARLMRAFRPDALHIATEGPLGMSAARLARAAGWRYTTAYHTRFPDYLAARIAMPRRFAYAWLRWFHGRGAGTMVATASLADELRGRGFTNIRLWSRGVDPVLFHPDRAMARSWHRPIFLSVGRLAVEKNLTGFLDLDLPGTRVVVGDGPERARLERRYAGPNVVFLGARQGVELAGLFASADVFVFPSRTDTFGLVVLEALASGVPVAAYPVAGPRDIIGGVIPAVGILDEDLRLAALGALGLSRAACRRFAEDFSWKSCASLFMTHLVPMEA